jgi:hypothetical protein
MVFLGPAMHSTLKCGFPHISELLNSHSYLSLTLYNLSNQQSVTTQVNEWLQIVNTLLSDF